MPLLIMFGVRKKLHRRAIIAAEAIRILDDSICRGCGQSGLLSYEDFGDGEYETRTLTCHGCVPLDIETHRENAEKLGHGEKRYVIDLHDDPRDEPEGGGHDE